MNFGSKTLLKKTSFGKSTTHLLAIFAVLLIVSPLVSASADVSIWMNKDTYTVGERAIVNFNFPRDGSYTLIQISPTRRTILRNQRVSAGRNRMTGTIERPTGRKTLKVVFKDSWGNTYTETTDYYVKSGSDQGGGQNGGGSEEGPPLQYFMSTNPSRAGDVARSLQNQVKIIRPGDSNYEALRRDFTRKSQSINLSRERQNLESPSFSFGASGTEMNFSIDPSKQDYRSLSGSLSNQGVTFFGSQGKSNNFMLIDPDPDPGPEPRPGGCGGCIVWLPCNCMPCCQPYFICLPRWSPWPLPPLWISWVITIAL